MKKYKIIFADLDGTLIDTISGETFPKGIWDMKIKFEVLDKIKELQPLALMIVTNQSYIESDFELKMEYIHRSINRYTGIISIVSYKKDYKSDNIDMVKDLWFNIQNKWYKHEGITCNDALMIGNASSEEKPNSNKEHAKNFGIDYIDVDDFVNGTK